MTSSTNFFVLLINESICSSNLFMVDNLYLMRNATRWAHCEFRKFLCISLRMLQPLRLHEKDMLKKMLNIQEKLRSLTNLSDIASRSVRWHWSTNARFLEWICISFYSFFLIRTRFVKITRQSHRHIIIFIPLWYWPSLIFI